MKTTSLAVVLALMSTAVGCGSNERAGWAKRGVEDTSPKPAQSTAPAQSAAAAPSVPGPIAQPATAQAPKPKRDASARLSVKRLLVATSVKDREPVDPATTFRAGDKLYAFVEVTNQDRVESEIVVTFEPESGPAIGHVKLDVGAAPRWRTWATSRAASKPGRWEAVVRDGEGKVLARQAFEIQPTEPSAVPAS